MTLPASSEANLLEFLQLLSLTTAVLQSVPAFTSPEARWVPIPPPRSRQRASGQTGENFKMNLHRREHLHPFCWDRG